MTAPTQRPSILSAVSEDWGAVEALLKKSGLPTDGAREHLHSFRIARSEDGAIIGTAGFEVYGRIGLLRSVTVRDEWRGAGVGKALVAAVVADARVSGLRDVYLLTTTASPYFTRLGFFEEPRERVPFELQASAELQGACPASATFMVLSITT